MTPLKDGACGVGKAFETFLALVVAYAVRASLSDANILAGATRADNSIRPTVLSKNLGTSVSIIHYVKDRLLHRDHLHVKVTP
jgi:hypothetical protein